MQLHHVKSPVNRWRIFLKAVESFGGWHLSYFVSSQKRTRQNFAQCRKARAKQGTRNYGLPCDLTNDENVDLDLGFLLGDLL